ncbi:unnamed protein product [Heterobilharzia americana]|nr:unnamed protein product [Heterobilharzia americana]
MSFFSGVKEKTLEVSVFLHLIYTIASAIMDIRRRTTYLSRGADGRPSHISSFFQSAQKKYCNADPDSGIRLVGPMFELTACVELKGDEEDFESMYPDTSLSFGPTICSFGLKYNDHNYALPSGLTPPSMAPHLMDLQIPKNKFGDTKTSSLYSKNLFNQKLNSKIEVDDFTQRYGIDKRFEKHNSLNVKRSAFDGSGAFNNDGRKHSGGPWYSKSTDSEDKTLVDVGSKDQYMTSRLGSQISNYEHMELRCEPELKVIEVPEELAVSPSQLSDLDSDTSDAEYVTKVAIPTSEGSTVDNTGNNVWADVRCVCGHSAPKSGFIRCPKCSTCQHVECMESYYNVTMPRLSDGYTCNLCGIETTEYQTSSNQSTDIILNNNNNNTTDIDKDSIGVTDDPASFIDSVKNSTVKLNTSSEGNIGAQYVEVAVDRAKRLGLLSNNCKLDSDNSRLSHSVGKEHDNTTGRPGWAPVNWEKLNEISRANRRHLGDTDVNLRMPSPPRASKRKQDLTSTSYNDAEVAPVDSSPDKTSNSAFILPNSGDEFSSADVTPSTTPSNTPMKSGSTLSLTPVTPGSTSGGTLTPRSGYGSSPGVEGTPRRHRLGTERSSNKVKRVLFSDSSVSNKRRFDARTNPLGAAWAKDYQEAESNVYTKALLERVNNRISTNVERNHKIPPTCLTRSSLCRVVLFDHNDKGLEASIRLAPNEVVTEVRGHFLLMEEYEHYVDPVSDYNRYVMFYRAFGDRVVVVDASQYGNSARFVRRSCIPNCRLEHYVVQSKLQIVIRTSWNGSNLDYSKYIESQLRVLSKPLSQDSSTNRSYDSGSLTSSPLVKTSISSNIVNQSTNLSSNVNYNLYPIKCNFRKEIELPYPDYNLNDEDKLNETSIDLDKTCSNQNYTTTNCTSSSSTSSSSIVINNQYKSIEKTNIDYDNLKNNNFVTDENQIPKTSESTNTLIEINSKISLQHIKDVSYRKNQNVTEEKSPFEPIITTRRQAAAAMKSVLR